MRFLIILIRALAQTRRAGAQRSVGFLIFLLLLTSTVCLKADEALASPNILLSETTTLTLSGKSLDWPRWPELSPLFLQQVKSEPLLQVADNQTKFTYRLGAVKTGLHQLPATQIGSQKTTPLLIRVYPDELLLSGEFFLDGQKTPFYSALLIANRSPFPGQSIAVEAKIYLPAELDILDPAYPEFTKENLAAGVFEPRQGTGELLINGRKFIAYSFSSRLSLLQNGEAKLSLGKIAPIINLRTFDRGIARWQKVRIDLDLPGVTLHAKTLPQPQPDGFSGAIGRFTLDATCEQSETSVNAPLQITLSIKGPGSNANTSAPTLSAPDGWKIGPATRNTQARKENCSVFTQIIRPLETHEAIPPFVFTYYDPATARYETARSESIPITIIPAKIESPLSGFSTRTDPLPRPWPLWTRWLWQIIPVGLTFYFIVKRLRQKANSSISKESDWHVDFTKLQTKKGAAAPEFFRALGQFLESHPLPDEDLQNAWLHERDLLCYQPDKKNHEKSPKATDILQKIKTLLTLLIFSLILAPYPAKGTTRGVTVSVTSQKWLGWYAPWVRPVHSLLGIATVPATSLPSLPPNATQSAPPPPTSKAAKTPSLPPNATQSAPNYSALQKDYATATPTIASEHNLAICAYNLGQTGLAAWHLRRSSVPESKKDLTLIEKETGAITRRKPEPSEIAAYLPRWLYTQVAFAGFWLVVIITLQQTQRKKTYLGLAAVLLFSAVYAFWFYPKDISFSPTAELATVIETSELRPAPFQSAPPIREIPAASLAKIIKIKNNWTYLEIPSENRGWILSSQVKAHAN